MQSRVSGRDTSMDPPMDISDCGRYSAAELSVRRADGSLIDFFVFPVYVVFQFGDQMEKFARTSCLRGL